MANIPNSPIAQHAAKAFDEMVDKMVMQNLAKGVDLSALGVGLAQSTTVSLAPGIGGQGKGIIER
jgi:hypothetical protein